MNLDYRIQYLKGVLDAHPLVGEELLKGNSSLLEQLSKPPSTNKPSKKKNKKKKRR